MRDTVLLTERVRHTLRAQITAKFVRGRNSLPVLLLDPKIEALVSKGIHHASAGSYLALEPQLTADLVSAICKQVDSLGSRAVDVPILVTAPEIRRYIRKMVDLRFPSLHVLSRHDLEPDMRIEHVAELRFDGSSHAPASVEQGASA